MPVGHFGLRHSTRMAGTPFTAQLGAGTYKCTPLDSRAGSNMRVAIEKQTHTIYGHHICQDKGHSAYCPTRRCTHNPPLCLSLSTARLLRLMYALVFIILLLSLDLPTVRQFLLRQTQLKCVMFGQLKDTKGVNDTVKVLKCCGISIFICSFLKVPCQCLHTLCSVGGVFS